MISRRWRSVSFCSPCSTPWTRAHDTFGGGPGEEAWKPMLVQEFAKQIEAHGGLGLAKPIYDAMMRMQETSVEMSNGSPGRGSASGRSCWRRRTTRSKRMDFTAAVALVPAKEAALADLTKQPRDGRHPTAAGRAWAASGWLAAENQVLLERAIAVQTRIVRIVARAGARRRRPRGTAVTADAFPSSRAATLALSTTRLIAPRLSRGSIHASRHTLVCCSHNNVDEYRVCPLTDW